MLDKTRKHFFELHKKSLQVALTFFDKSYYLLYHCAILNWNDAIYSIKTDVWQLLFGFCLISPMHCVCYVEGNGLLLLFISKWLHREIIEWKFTALLLTGHKVSEVANLVEVSRTTIYPIKKCMDDGEDINRCAGSFQKTVVPRMASFKQSSPSNSIPQAVIIHKSFKVRFNNYL